MKTLVMLLAAYATCLLPLLAFMWGAKGGTRQAGRGDGDAAPVQLPADEAPLAGAHRF